MDRALTTDAYEIATPETRAGKLRSTLENTSVEAVLVVDQDEVVGVVIPRDLLQSRLSDDAQAQAIMGTVLRLDPETDSRERLIEKAVAGLETVAVDDLYTPDYWSTARSRWAASSTRSVKTASRGYRSSTTATSSAS